LRFRVLHLTSDGRWIEHTKFDIKGRWLDVFDEIEPDTAAGILWDRFGRLPTELESFRHAFESSTRPPSRERTPEAPAELPDLVTLDQAAAVGHRKKRRGRTAGVSKVDLAIAEVSSRLKKGVSVEVAEIARTVGCKRENLARSRRFMDAYRELARGMTRAARYRGSRHEGKLEAWVDPRGDRED